MNCYSHAFRFLDRDPYFVVGTCVPDWLTLADRKVRVRKKNARLFMENTDPNISELAKGIVRHHLDDDWFHENRCFVELNLALSIELRELLGSDAGFRPHLAAHILIEVLLDRALTLRNPSGLETFYEMVAQVDPARVEAGVNEITSTKKTDRIALFVPRFLTERYLFDYLTDEGINYRLNRVLRRVKLAELPAAFLDWIPSAWDRVEKQQDDLLSGFESSD